MKAWSILQLMLFVMLLVGPSEEFFLEYPKKALQEFLQSLKKQKPPPIKSNIQHYHVHYYPMPYSMLTWPKWPIKRDLEKFYDDTLASFGWPDYNYNYLPPPPSIIMSGLQQLLDAETPISDDTPATIDRSGQGLLLQIPVNQYMFLLKRQRQLAKAMT